MQTSNTELVNAFKAGMRRLTSTVALITTSEEGVPFGMAVTAVCSVGINPPSLLISVAHTASMHGPVTRQRRFCVNLLNETHAEMVGAFSGKLKGAKRFELGNWTYDASGVPHLADAQAVFTCETAQETEHAEHTVIIGKVVDVKTQEPIAPLLYENGHLARAKVLQ
tara:strand:- start:227 stop:727 length:501 start_codon:yes stop_codon:yes gene_type:complete